METLNRYNVHCFGAAPEADDIERTPEGRWMEAADVLRVLGERDAAEQDRSESNEALSERLRLAENINYELQEQVRSVQTDRERRLLEIRRLGDELREQTKRAEDMVTMNASLIAERNRATLSCRYANKLRDIDRAELVKLRQRVGHLTGRVIDSAVLLNRHVRRPDFMLVQQTREFVDLLRKDTEGYTMTGPCDIPLLYGKIDLLKEDGTPMPTNEESAMPAPEPGVPVRGPGAIYCNASERVTRPATDGTPVAVHPEFAKVYDQAPGLWQGCVDAAAADAKRLGIDPANPSEEDQRALSQAAVLTPPEAEEPEEQDIQF